MLLGMGFFSYLMTCVSLSVVVGMAILYPLERLVGIRLYRLVYDLFHTEPMPTTVTRGLLYGQPTQRKVTVLMTLSVLQSLVMIWTHHVNPAVEIIAAVVEVPATLFGFIIGGYIHPYIVRRSEYFDKLDTATEKLGSVSGEDVKKMSGDVVRGAGLKGLSLMARLKEWVYPSSPSPVLSQTVVPEPKPEVVPVPEVEFAKDEPSARARLDSFLKGRS